MDHGPRSHATGGSTPVAAALARIATELDWLQGAPLLGHSDAQAREGVAAVARLRARLDAVYLHVLADLDARPDAVPGAAPGAVGATFLRHVVNATPQRAAHDVRAARALDPDRAGITADGALTADPTRPDGLPHPGSALAVGEVSLDHVDAVLACLRRIPGRFLRAVTDADCPAVPSERTDPDQSGHGNAGSEACQQNRRLSGTARVDAFLTEQARRFSATQLRRIGRQLAASIHPDGEEDYDPKALDRRRLDYGTDASGMLVGSFALDPVAGSRFRAVIDALTAAQAVGGNAVGHTPRPAHPGDDPGDGTGDGAAALAPQPLRDERTASQRRADALHQLCRDAMPADFPDPTADEPDVEPGGRHGPRADDRSPDRPREAWHQQDGGDRTPESGLVARRGAQAVLPTTRPSRGSTQVLVIATPAQLAAAMAATRSSDAQQTKPPGACGPGLAVDVATGPVDPGALSMLLCSAVFHGVVLRDPSAPRAPGGAPPSPAPRPPTPQQPSTTPPPDTSTDLGEHPLGGAVLALGRSRRLATAAQLRAVIARDRGCVVPGCTLPPGRCDAHHVIWWRHGGLTDVDNLAMLCARHHACVHAGHWRIEMIDGLPWVIAPRWVDPTQTPRRNALPDAEHTARALGQRLRPEDAA